MRTDRLLVHRHPGFGSGAPTVAAEFPRFQVQEIDPHAGEICYAVTVADVNGDQKPDVVAVTEDAVVWYENPSWHKHDVIRGKTARDNVCIQPHDIDGDGRVDFALGAGWHPPDTKNPSTLQWLGRDGQGHWQVHPIRIRRAHAPPAPLGRRERNETKATRRRGLARARHQGPKLGGRAGRSRSGLRRSRSARPQSWPVEIADSSLHTIHNLQLSTSTAISATRSWWRAGRACSCSTATRRGNGPRLASVPVTRMSNPSKGSSEVKVGRWGKNLAYVATIEPWHGHQVVVYAPTESTQDLGVIHSDEITPWRAG